MWILIRAGHKRFIRITRLPEVVSVSIGSVPGLKAESGVEVLVVEDDGEASALVVHVVRLGVLVHRHPGHVRLRPGGNPGTPESPGITLRGHIDA